MSKQGLKNRWKLRYWISVKSVLATRPAHFWKFLQSPLTQKPCKDYENEAKAYQCGSQNIWAVAVTNVSNISL